MWFYTRNLRIDLVVFKWEEKERNFWHLVNNDNNITSYSYKVRAIRYQKLMRCLLRVVWYCTFTNRWSFSFYICASVRFPNLLFVSESSLRSCRDGFSLLAFRCRGACFVLNLYSDLLLKLIRPHFCVA